MADGVIPICAAISLPLKPRSNNIAEPIDEPRFQADIGRMVLQWPPVMLHLIDSILVSQRHKVQVLFPPQLILLVIDIIGYLTIPVEIVAYNIGISPSEAAQNLFVR